MAEPRYTPDEALLIAMELIEQTHPSADVLKVVERLKSEAHAHALASTHPAAT